jgi:general secretion pathway protein C
MKIFPKFVTLILAGVLCGLVAFWLIRLRETSPPVVAITPLERPRHFDHELQARLFGISPRVEVTRSRVDIRLAGVIAPDNKKGRGIAILAVESRPMRAYRTGEEMAPGIQLLEVQPRRVFIEQNGQRIEIALPTPELITTPKN